MRILCVGAHPDDIEFGCGASLSAFARQGASIHLYVSSRGEVGGNAQTRQKEQERVARTLHASLTWGGFEDTKLHITRDLIEAVEVQIQRVKPDLIFTHYRMDTHQDHHSIALAVITASRYIQNVVFFETPSTIDFTPTVFMDISQDLAAKLKLLRLHRSQVYKTNIPNRSILEISKSTAVYRGYQYRVKYAEGFMPQRFSLDGRGARRR